MRRMLKRTELKPSEISNDNKSNTNTTTSKYQIYNKTNNTIDQST